MRFKSTLLVLLLFVNVSYADESCEDMRRFTFSWPYSETCEMTPRGGTTRGAEVELDKTSSTEWLGLQDESLTEFERDRRAILAMAGGYRTSFDFLETIGYVPGYKPTKPYQSWGTELVLVAEDRGDFISLQHLMVMYFVTEEGEVSGPMVMKHWRQDWQYQPHQFMAYDGNDQWSMHLVNAKEASGTWAQTVYQVDDSPRYGGYGRWQHLPNFSTWESNETWRPLPRREYSVRSDYQVLIGTNRQTILPHGWVHEQENFKVQLNEAGGLKGQMPYLAKELGVNRYDKVINIDFSAGKDYWSKTGPFWRDVADFWTQKLVIQGRVSFKTRMNDQLMFQALFDYAESVQKNGQYDYEAGRAFIANTLRKFFQE